MQRRGRALATAGIFSLVSGLVAAAAVASPAPVAGPPVAADESMAAAWLPVPVVPTVPSLLSCSGLPSPAAAGVTRPSPAPPSDYYAIELVPTGRVPGTRLAKGFAYSTAAASPFFGVAVAPAGTYVHDLDIQVEGLSAPRSGAWVAWATDSEVSEIVRIGALDERLRVRGQVTWNKFLVVITREPSTESTDSWQGPIIMRGMSRSGRMHTLAGHGPFQAEPCAKYGFR